MRADDRRCAIAGTGVARADDERVIAPTAKEGIYAVSAIDYIIAWTAVDEVITIAANKYIIACFAVDRIVAPITYDPIMACAPNATTTVIAVDDIVRNGADDAIIAAASFWANIGAIGEVAVPITPDNNALRQAINGLAYIMAERPLHIACIAIAHRQSAREGHRNISVPGHPHRARSLVLRDGVAAAPAAHCRASISRHCQDYLSIASKRCGTDRAAVDP